MKILIFKQKSFLININFTKSIFTTIEPNTPFQFEPSTYATQTSKCMFGFTVEFSKSRYTTVILSIQMENKKTSGQILVMLCWNENVEFFVFMLKHIKF